MFLFNRQVIWNYMDSPFKLNDRNNFQLKKYRFLENNKNLNFFAKGLKSKCSFFIFCKSRSEKLREEHRMETWRRSLGFWGIVQWLNQRSLSTLSYTPGMLCTVLYCTVLYCTVLYCTYIVSKYNPQFSFITIENYHFSKFRT